MTEATMALMEYLRKHDLLESDFLRDAVQLMMQQLIELEVSEQVGAGHYERSAERVTQRNGYRPRQWETRVGQIPLRIPKLRQGSYFPSLLEPRKRSEKALLAVVQEAYVKGVSTRKVDDLVRALGLKGISKSKVSRICQELDQLVTAFLKRRRFWPKICRTSLPRSQVEDDLEHMAYQSRADMGVPDAVTGFLVPLQIAGLRSGGCGRSCLPRLSIAHRTIGRRP